MMTKRANSIVYLLIFSIAVSLINTTFALNCNDPNDDCMNSGVCDASTGFCKCSTGDWFGPRCNDSCESKCPSQQNLICEKDSNAPIQDNNVTCACKEGYKLNDNSTFSKTCRKDYCGRKGFDCNGNGTCNDTTGEYKCECYEGYNGPDCEFYCLEVCNNHSNTYCDYDGFCHCEAGLKPNSGEPQDKGCFKDFCEKTECHNNGKCENNANYAYCNCTASNYGLQCNKTCDDYCFPDYNLKCNTTEYSNETENIPQCECKSEQYTRKNESNILDGCQIDLCINLNPCNHSTECKIISDTDYHCTCDADFFGKNCTDPCSSKCNVTNQKCVLDEQNFNNDVTCECADGFGGNDCEINCLEECGGNAICNNTAGNVACYCENNYVDVPKSDNKTNCVKDICAENVCKNGAGCNVSSDGSYSCVCHQNFIGKNCSNLCDDYCNSDKNLTCSATQYSNEVNDIPECECKSDQYTSVNKSNISEGCYIDLCENLKPCDNYTGIKCERISDTDYRCMCKPGFFGKNCTEPCSSMCNGTNEKCVPKEQNFNNDVTCECADGFGGNDCEINCKEECGENAICNNTAGNVACYCENNYVDVPKSDNKTNCVKDLCKDDPCEHDGTCRMVDSDKRHCDCTDQYKGEICDCLIQNWNGTNCVLNDTSVCYPVCKDYEECVDKNCHCKSEYKQPDGTCGEKRDVCLGVQCPSNSFCITTNLEPGYECHCNESYFNKKPDVTDTGVECEKIFSNTTCKILGKIFNETTEMCQCPDNFEDIDDENGCKPVSPCDENICGSNSVCANNTITSNTSECLCKKGYEKNSTNNDCIDIDECVNDYFSSTCQPLGSCNNTDGSYDCDCGTNTYNNISKTCHQPEDGCADGKHGCDPISTVCKNQDSGFICECVDNYERIPENDTHCRVREQCTDVQKQKCGEKAKCKITLYKPEKDQFECVPPPAYYYDANLNDSVLATYVYSGEIKLNDDFVDDLQNPGSKRYQELKYEFEDKISEFFGNNGNKVWIQVTNFRSGSVLVDYDLLSNVELNSTILRNILKTEFDNKECNVSTTLNLDCNFDKMNILNDNSSCSTRVLQMLCPTDTYNCIPNVDGKPYVCNCKDGYTEVRIDEKFASCNDIDECKSKPHCTAPHQKCINTRGSFTCICEEGFIFKNDICQEICSDNTCENDGKCVVDADKKNYDCECQVGFGGKHCETALRSIDTPNNTVWEIVVGVLAATLIVTIIISLIVVRRVKKKCRDDSLTELPRNAVKEVLDCENQHPEARND